MDNDNKRGILNFGIPADETPKVSRPMVNFGAPQGRRSIIKVIGVGGGGGNAVNHMFREGIHDVSFVVCNTDSQALNNSEVPVKLQLGTEGLGAGNKPEKGRLEAENSVERIKEEMSDGTKMVFITAGMGGGTGTGAAPVVARVAKEMGILTVGIVTIPFRFEGSRKIIQALVGVEEMSKHVDALLVINNERLREIYSDLTVLTAFNKANDTLCVAAKSIAEIITRHTHINLDFNDVQTVLKDGGVAIMSIGYGEGEGRVKKAIDDALKSPLLSNNDVFNSKRILLLIEFSDKEGDQELKVEEMSDVHEFMAKFVSQYDIKWGIGTDSELGNKVKITILASGFGLNDVDGMPAQMTKRTQEDINREMHEETLIGTYYGDEDCVPRHNPNIFCFQPEELDDDEVILAVENTPTYKRTKTEVDEIRNHAKKTKADKESEPVGRIVF